MKRVSPSTTATIPYSKGTLTTCLLPTILLYFATMSDQDRRIKHLEEEIAFLRAEVTWLRAELPAQIEDIRGEPHPQIIPSPSHNSPSSTSKDPVRPSRTTYETGHRSFNPDGHTIVKLRINSGHQTDVNLKISF